jgi:hypothetical protein
VEVVDEGDQNPEQPAEEDVSPDQRIAYASVEESDPGDELSGPETPEVRFQCKIHGPRHRRDKQARTEMAEKQLQFHLARKVMATDKPRCHAQAEQEHGQPERGLTMAPSELQVSASHEGDTG